MINLPHPTAAPAAPLTQAEREELEQLEQATHDTTDDVGQIFAYRYFAQAMAEYGPRLLATLAAQAAENKTQNLMLISAVRAARVDLDAIERLTAERDTVTQKYKELSASYEGLGDELERSDKRTDAAQQERDEARAKLQELEEHHHKYATMAAHEWDRACKRGNAYRARALALREQCEYLRAKADTHDGYELRAVKRATEAVVAAAAQQRVGELERLVVRARTHLFPYPGSAYRPEVCKLEGDIWATVPWPQFKYAPDVDAALSVPATPAAPGHGGASEKSKQDALAVERGRILDAAEAAHKRGDLTDGSLACVTACVLIDLTPPTPADIEWAKGVIAAPPPASAPAATEGETQ